ncbi:uncharacterized protein IL334_002902 [Kwoniella shivajii]|uniref:Glycosyltransferase family 32 protein n=1 Tax=Kwoniella shivajii TaxID=564305 RepID=A0ABZ1CW06_9TREE|nr:hypothetical protein IL334_002902 [Kwoniella shivajii]
MDSNGTLRANKTKPHLAQQIHSTRSSLSDAESSRQGWSGAEWNTNSTARSSHSSGDEQRRSTIDTSRPSYHPNGSGSALYDVTTSSPVRSTHSPLSNGYAQSGPSHSSDGFTTSAYANASSSYARSRRKETETGVEVESESEDGSNHNHKSAKGRLKNRGRGSSFSLPFHRRRRLSDSLPWPAKWWPGGGGFGSRSSNKRGLLIILVLLASLIWGISIWKKKYEIQVEFSVFKKKWIKEEIDSISKLKGCFQNPSSQYNITKHNSPKRYTLNPGISLKRGMACYDYSSTIQPIPELSPESLIYHTYWRSDLIPFGERQIITFLSFLATQPLEYSKLILWTNGMDILQENENIKPYLEKWGEYIEIRQVYMDQLTQGTDLEPILSSASRGNGNGKQNVFDQKAWVDGDAIRLLVLWHYGGIWMDMDQILTRDLHPLMESEWTTQWDCYDKPYFSLNGALMHFERHSPYLCEAFHLMSTSPFPEPNTFTWGSHLYSKLHRALLADHIKPFGVLPWCFADPRNCRTDNRFPDPFETDPTHFAGKEWDNQGGREELEERVGQVWTVHLHNQWNKKFPKNGWVERLLEGYKGQLERLERYAEARGLTRQGRVVLGKKEEEF